MLTGPSSFWDVFCSGSKPDPKDTDSEKGSNGRSGIPNTEPFAVLDFAQHAAKMPDKTLAEADLL